MRRLNCLTAHMMIVEGAVSRDRVLLDCMSDRRGSIAQSHAPDPATQSSATQDMRVMPSPIHMAQEVGA